ncbi:MAG: hypothetical protein UW32_C0001G0403 [Candidatus Wolfebacteria bacterium GW2011_GWE2_44_13]|uniref:Uncharacterized protein n=1 Tax=Candidatus Wolfebacteria bacterium GW2011_GWE2_44_13 TaxID=1619017 RepID=A0A0G1H8W5_9BACT|nr:MAG: hypothetical protein UW32_C0001G0403 [Candidatus Wolfebacteria bacterium GW2011_GWE2_44_13]
MYPVYDTCSYIDISFARPGTELDSTGFAVMPTPTSPDTAGALGNA